MSVAQGRARTGRSSRAGSTRPGRTSRIGGAIRAGARMLGGGARAGGRRRRGRGISKTELRGFRKVVRLLRSVGMVPKGTRRAAVRRT